MLFRWFNRFKVPRFCMVLRHRTSSYRNNEFLLEQRKIYKYRCITHFVCWQITLFCFFCSDLAMLIFPKLMADIQRPNRKSAQGPRGGDLELLKPNPLYCFTIIFKSMKTNLAMWRLRYLCGGGISILIILISDVDNLILFF